MTDKLENTKIYKNLKARGSSFIGKIEELFLNARDVLPKINSVFDNYTEHDIFHSLRVADYMFDLCDDPDALSELELTVMLYVSLLHDVGMAVNETDISLIKNDKYKIGDRKYIMLLEDYDEKNALQEFIRPIHGIRSAEHIKEMDEKYFSIKGNSIVSFKDEVALICRAHNEDFEWLKENLEYDNVKGQFSLNSQYIAMLLRVADYLDIDGERTPEWLYKFLGPKERSDLEWKQHFIIENKNKINTNQKTNLKEITFYGSSDNPNVHRKLMGYFELLSEELSRTIKYSKTFQKEQYNLLIWPEVIDKIKTKGFQFSDKKITLNYKAITNLLMGESIYGNKEYGLRELIQNAIDACMCMKESSKDMDTYKYDEYNPEIQIVIDHDLRQLLVIDNGQGISENILINYFLNIGSSFYKSAEYKYRGMNYQPIGNYGIGFLSCFMLSNSVEVKTRYFRDEKTIRVELFKDSEYICLKKEEGAKLHGTEIVLNLDQFLTVFKEGKKSIESFIIENFAKSDVSINVLEIKNKIRNTSSISLSEISLIIPNNIKLDKYFNNIEIYLSFDYKDIKFWEYLSDIGGKVNIIFNEKENEVIVEKELDDRFLLKQYVSKNILNYLSIPILDNENGYYFSQALDVLDDIDSALLKVEYSDANVIMPDNNIFYNHGVIMESNEEIAGLLRPFTLGEFRQITGHDDDSPTCVMDIDAKVITGTGYKLLPYSAKYQFNYSWSYEKSDFLYIRNILVKNSKTTIPFCIRGITFKKIVINVRDNSIIPDVPRNNINDKQREDLSYAIGKAIHLFIYEEGSFEKEERELIKNFINQHYSEKNQHISDKYNGVI